MNAWIATLLSMWFCHYQSSYRKQVYRNKWMINNSSEYHGMTIFLVDCRSRNVPYSYIITLFMIMLNMPLSIIWKTETDYSHNSYNYVQYMNEQIRLTLKKQLLKMFNPFDAWVFPMLSQHQPCRKRVYELQQQYLMKQTSITIIAG